MKDDEETRRRRLTRGFWKHQRTTFNTPESCALSQRMSSDSIKNRIELSERERAPEGTDGGGVGWCLFGFYIRSLLHTTTHVHYNLYGPPDTVHCNNYNIRLNYDTTNKMYKIFLRAHAVSGLYVVVDTQWLLLRWWHFLIV